MRPFSLLSGRHLPVVRPLIFRGLTVQPPPFVCCAAALRSPLHH
ncbi:TPA: DUF1472 domain-containing protein [Enterobacter hormaechei subsp. steigerwaltii]|nr:DUF1472 domain-containing protein [Enterobacter hormaechei subsp. steigerwaltii]